jgi:4-amino-4-deoxy-L-arabinose transferase-like glycosyltransferase
LTVFLTFRLARELLSAGWALIAAMLTAISPHLATITAEILTESLFTLALVAAAWCSARAFRLRRAHLAMAAGVLWGAAALVRPTAEFLPPLILLATLFLPALRSYRRTATALTIAALALQAPWWVRNQVTDLRPTSDNLTINFLHHGSYPNFMYQGRIDTLGFPYRFDPESPRIGRSVGSALSNIVDNFRSKPLETTHWYLVGKPISFLSWRIVGGWGDIFTSEPIHSPFLEDRRFSAIHAFMRALHTPLMLLGVLGALLAAWNPSWLGLGRGAVTAARLVAAVIGYAVVLHMVGAPFPRYGIPFRPLMYVLALIPLATLARMTPRHGRSGA